MHLPPASEIEQLIQLAMQREQAGDMAGALRAARQALDLAGQDSQPLDRARALTAVARYRFRLGQYEVARSLAQEALTLSDSDQEPQAAIRVEALLLMGMCAAETYSITECEQYYCQAADLAREIGNQLLFLRALHNLGSGVYLFRGQFDLAIAADSQSLDLCRALGYTGWSIFPLITLGVALQITGQRQRAHQILAELRSVSQLGSAGEGYGCYVGGMLAMDEDDFPLAEAEFQKALAVAEQLGDPSLNLDTRLGISRMHRRQGEEAKAITWAEDALNFARRVGYRIYQGRALLERGRAERQEGRLVSAENDLSQAEAIFTELEMRCDLVEAQLELVAIYQTRGDAGAADLFLHSVEAVQAGGFAFLLQRERALVYPLIARFLNDINTELARAAAVLLEELQDTPPKPIRVRTLGRFEVWVGPLRVDARTLRQRRAGEVLVFLLTSPGQTLTSQQIADALCPGKGPAAAADFYHHAISALRRLLEPDLPDRRFPCRYLDVSEERVTLIIPPGSMVDFKVFELHCEKGEWEQAVTLYQGEFLPMYRYADWAISSRQHYEDQYERGLLALAAQRLSCGEAAACLSLSQKILRLNNWQEQAAELGMRAALALGDRVAAIKIYKRLEKDLDHELGIEPQENIRQLYISIKAG